MTRPSFSLSQKAFLAFAVVLLPILVIFLISYLNSKKELEGLILKDLRVHADDRGEDVIGFIERNKQRAEDFASDGFIRERLKAVEARGKDEGGRLGAYIRTYKMPLNPKILRIALFSLSGVIVSTDPAHPVEFPDGAAGIASGADGARVRVIPSGASGAPEVVFIAPMKALNGGAVVWTLAMFLPLNELEKIVAKWARPAFDADMTDIVRSFNSLDIYLVDANGMLLTEARYTDNKVFRVQLKNPLLDACVGKGQRSTGVYNDYRGVEVEGASMCIQPSGWTLLVEVDRDEALKPMYDNMRYAVVSGLIVVVLLGALYIYFGRLIIAQIGGLTAAARRVAAGNYEIRLPVKSRDELGVLTGAFNEMAGGLKEKTDALEETALNLLNAQRMAHIGSLEWKPQTDEMSWSAELYRIFGVLPSSFEPSHKGLLEFIHPDSRDAMSAAFEDARVNGRPYGLVCRIIRDNGALRVVRVQGEASFDDAGAVVKVSGIIHDITEQARLEELHTRLTAIIEATPDFIASADTEGRALYYNTAARKMLGIVKSEDISLIRIPDTHPEWAARLVMTVGLPAAARNGSWSGETAFLTKNGHEIPVLQVIIAHKDAEGRVDYYSTIARDITERKAAEEAMVKMNAELEARVAARTAELQEVNRELEAFSYSVAHDLRAPLRIIDGFSHALQEDLGDRLDPVSFDHLRRVRGASGRMGQLIDDLLKLSRITMAEMSHDTVNLSTLAGVVAAELKKAAPGRKVEFVIEKGLTVTGDVRLLRVAMENLINNAWKFTGNKEEARIEFGASGSKDGRRVFYVRDNGAGFDMRYSDKLFGAFQRLHASSEFQGTGIGLATVARIIKRHGGAVWAEGAVERGAVFYFTI
ncbi:MAG: PAS domain S-box protein [Deltaproteobacteria bacterium]|nr:PAS domain S-box protein [Deltaproteobacteria bacterium]